MSDKLQRAIDDEIAALEEKRDRCLEEAKRAQASIDGLQGVRGRLAEMTANDAKPLKKSAKRLGRNANTTACVLDYLQEHPGAQALEVIDALENKVCSKAKDRRHSIRTTLFNLEKKGKLVRDGKTKGYSLSNEA